MNILDKILNTKKQEIASRQSLYPIRYLEQSQCMTAPCVSLTSYLTRSDLLGVIAEIKRASPSAGPLNTSSTIESISTGYMRAGASALSIVTDESYFCGSLQDIVVARASNYCPILRKDFILDEYQIIEARSAGADAILLIAKALTPTIVKRFAAFAHSLGMEVLLELHDEHELATYPLEEADVIGINARNLQTLQVDFDFVFTALDKLPSETITVAESGIRHPQDLVQFKRLGCNGFLIGESFMRTADPAESCRRFILQAKEMYDAQ